MHVDGIITRRQQLMDLAIISSKVYQRKDLIEVSFDTKTRVAMAYPKQSKSKLSGLWSDRMNSDNIYECCVDKAYYRFHSEGVVWKAEACVDVVVCLVSVLLFRGYRYPFLPPSQIIIASPAFCSLQVVPPPMLLL